MISSKENKRPGLLERYQNHLSDTDSRIFAVDSLYDFIGKPQIPQASFSARSASTFDITHLNNGTVFRLRTQIHNETQRFNGFRNFWYITGLSKNGIPNVYYINHYLNRELPFSSGMVLTMGKSFCLEDVRFAPDELLFPIANAGHSLIRRSMLPKQQEFYNPQRIDIMAPGRVIHQSTNRISLPASNTLASARVQI